MKSKSLDKMKNRNSGGGDILQGLPPSCNRPILTRKVNKSKLGYSKDVFFINQLGGVGRFRSQTKFGDGVPKPNPESTMEFEPENNDVRSFEFRYPDQTTVLENVSDGENIKINGSVEFSDVSGAMFNSHGTSDGSNGYISIDTFDLDFSGCSVEIFATLEDFNSNLFKTDNILIMSNGSGSGYNLVQKDNSDIVKVEVSLSENSANKYSFDVDISRGTFFHLVTTYEIDENNKLTWKAYKDSVYVDSSYIQVTPFEGSINTIRIGSEEQTNINVSKLYGNVKYVSFHRKVLSASKIVELYDDRHTLK